MNCLNCNSQNTTYHFRVLQVQTLHIRDLTKEHKVQALGEITEYEICAKCAKEKLEYLLNQKQMFLKKILPFLSCSLLGALITYLFWHQSNVFRLMGISMIICGLLCIWTRLREFLSKRAELLNLPKDIALYHCAWECLLENLPHKDGDNDLTYIPINKETLSRKNGDLMILYHLLPEIAKEAYQRIHN